MDIRTGFQSVSIIISVILLTSCGGSGSTTEQDDNSTSQTFSVGGTISGNTDGLALSLNGSSASFTVGAFTFRDVLNDGDNYEVLFVTAGANESCMVANGSGTISGEDITNIEVVCEEISTMSMLQYADTAILSPLAAGDFNGDGNDDLAFLIRTLDGNPLGNNLYFVRYAFGNGLGTFVNTFDVQTDCNFSAAGKRGYTLLAADFNGDLFDDIVCAGGDSHIEVFSGADEPESTFIENELGSNYFKAVDVNADGLIDILDLGDGTGSVVVTPNFEYYENSGTSDFGDIQSFAILRDIEDAIGPFGGVGLFVISDVNGDLRDDLITLNGLRNFGDDPFQIAVFLGDNAGGFSLPTSSTVIDDIDASFLVTEEFRDLVSGDFDADGNIDIAISYAPEKARILLGDGMGGFTQNGEVTVGRNPVHIASADFNGDGALDLATINQDDHSLHISLGFGDGTFGSEDTLPADFISIPLDTGVDLYDLVLADFDGNGLPDIAFSETGLDTPSNANGSVQVFLNPGQ